MKKSFIFPVILVFLMVFTISCKEADISHNAAKKINQTLSFNSSDNELNQLFSWAKKQALAYSFSDDPVGLWYEAALPGREAFCMRDVSHQAMGAHFLGLAPYTKNMLMQFAANISESRDWCSYWEINRYGDPAPVDYLSDDNFWYNLPANFDVLDCCYRMYTLTGDQDFYKDPVFLNFYKRTVYDYVERWDLSIDKIMSRKRYINYGDDFDKSKKFAFSRGIPGYNEIDKDYRAGIDLLVSEIKAFVAYTRFMELAGEIEESEKSKIRADEFSKLLHDTWWDEDTQSFYNYLNKENELTHLKSNQDHAISLNDIEPWPLHWRAIQDTKKLHVTLEKMLKNLPDKADKAIEIQSHLPEILYHYNENEAAYQQLLHLFNNDRREYPEASFAAVGAMVTGMMGIELEVHPPSEASTDWSYVDRIITTLSRLTDVTSWAEMDHIPIRKNDISIRHEGSAKTVISNNHGPSILWKARFYGSHENLLLNGKPVPARVEDSASSDKKISYIEVIVGAGEILTVMAE